MPKVGPFTVTARNTKAAYEEGDAGEDPTQQDLKALADKHRNTLKELVIDVQGSADFDLTIDAEVSIGCLPKLKVLELKGTDISKMRLTKEVFPALESLELSGFETPLQEFHLDLPNLRSLDIEHLEIEHRKETANCLGDSLTRCPKLVSVSTYKFGPCHGFNFMVLPACEELHLHRAENMNRLEFLDAPKLQVLNVQAAFELGRISLYDYAAATCEDALQLSQEWVARSSQEEAKAFAERYKKYLADKKEASRGSRRTLPPCVINRENVNLPKGLVKELQENTRVQLVGECGFGMSDEEEEDDDDEEGSGFIMEADSDDMSDDSGWCPLSAVLKGEQNWSPGLQRR